MKKITFDSSDISRYQTPKQIAPEHPYEYWVNKTAKLIGRSYIQTAVLVKDWPLHKIERRFKEAINCHEQTTPTIRWWSLRKQELSEALTSEINNSNSN
jgi:hypothetical protein